MSVMTGADFDVLRIDSKPITTQSLGPTVTSLSELTDVQINEPLLDGQILKYIQSTGKWTNVDPQLITNDFIEGYATFSGTSYTTTFQIAHGFGDTPTHFIVDPQTPEAQDDFTVTVDNIHLNIEYSFPPPQGTDNLSFYYRVS
jgi:hypothetical protein